MAQFTKGQSGNPAGRPSKADKFAGQIAKAEGRIAKNLVRYIENMEALADGIYVEEMTLEGARVVYKRPPDRQANQYLIDRIMGKPTDRKEHTFPDKPLEEMSEDELRAIRDS
jgi:hypothetical protein